MPGKGFSTKYGTPVGDSVRQDPMDALATLLGIDSQGTPNSVGISNDFVDPSGNNSLELSSLRGAREGELQDRVNNGGDPRAGRILGDLQNEIKSDPFTGEAQKAQADKNRESYTTAVTMNEPTTPEAIGQKHLEDFLIRKAKAEHPTTPLFPGMGEGQGGFPAVPAGAQGAAPAGDTAGRFEQLTSDLPPDAKALLKGMIDYTAPVPTGSTALKAFAPLIGRALQIDPTWDVNSYASRGALRKSFEAGPESDRLRSLNALIGHLATLDQDREALNNNNVGGKLVNAPVNAFEQFLNMGSAGHGNVPAFDTTHGHVVSEMAKFLAGSGGATDEQRRALNSGISSASGDEDIQGYIRAAIELADKQFGGMLSKAGTVPSIRAHVLSQLSPEARAILKSAQTTQGVQ